MDGSREESVGLARVVGSSGLPWLLFVSIIASWMVVAVTSNQPLLAAQRSRDLLEVGAVDGALLRAGEWWRLLVSQFLHVHAPHMLFNALAILAIGALVERSSGRWWFLAVYVVGGSAGQLASVAFYPGLVSSGASQALMALCGAALLVSRSRMTYMVVVPVLAIQGALDLTTAGTIKAGHGWGLVAGVLLGTVVRLLSSHGITTRLRAAQHPGSAARDSGAARSGEEPID